MSKQKVLDHINKGAKALFLVIMFCASAHAQTIPELIDSLGLTGILQGDQGSIEAQLLTPPGTDQNDTVGLDASDNQTPLDATLGEQGLIGFSEGTLIPLNGTGLDQLLTALGLGQDTLLASNLRSLIGPEGAVIVPLVDGVDSATAMLQDGTFQLADALALPGLNDQPIALSLLNNSDGGNVSADGLAGVALISDGSSGNGGLIGVAILSGDNSGAGDLAGVGVLSGDSSGNSGTLGVSVLSGTDSGNSDFVAAGALNDSNSGNVSEGGLAGIGALNGDNSGNGGLIAAGALNGNNSGNADGIAVGALNNENAGNGEFGSVGALNQQGAQRGSGIINIAALNEAGNGDNNSDAGIDCEASNTCDDNQSELSGNSACVDYDGDGVCDAQDACPDTPAGKVVYVDGCHLRADAPLILKGVNFEFDSIILTTASRPLLARAREVIQSEPKVLISIDGHTDSKGSDSYNQKLSHRRAKAIQSYFTDNGIDESRLTYRGFGESMPIAPNTNSDGSDNPEGRALNRRVELKIVSQEEFEQIKAESP